MCDSSKMNGTKYVLTGEIAVGLKDEIVASSPLGSCIAFVAYDTSTKIGGIAHAMLPGISPEGNSNKYVVNAISNLLNLMKESGVLLNNIQVCLVGCANVLQRTDDTIAENMCKSVEQATKDKKVNIIAKSLGGVLRRSVSININTGKVYLSIGDGENVMFCDFNVYIDKP
jgi:chemotaxis protein CheD